MNIILCKVLYKMKMYHEFTVAGMTRFLWRILQLILFPGYISRQVFEKVMVENTGNPGKHIGIDTVFLQNAVNVRTVA